MSNLVSAKFLDHCTAMIYGEIERYFIGNKKVKLVDQAITCFKNQ
jgi:hypothetical protein